MTSQNPPTLKPALPLGFLLHPLLFKPRQEAEGIQTDGTIFL